jgi:hypothetical protein
MLTAALVVLATLSISHWLLEPLVGLITPFFSLAWLGWAGLTLFLWAFAGAPGSNGGPE